MRWPVGTSPAAASTPRPAVALVGHSGLESPLQHERDRNLKGLTAEELGLKEQVDICSVFFLFFCPLSSIFVVS